MRGGNVSWVFYGDVPHVLAVEIEVWFTAMERKVWRTGGWRGSFLRELATTVALKFCQMRMGTE